MTSAPPMLDLSTGRIVDDSDRRTPLRGVDLILAAIPELRKSGPAGRQCGMLFEYYFDHAHEGMKLFGVSGRGKRYWRNVAALKRSDDALRYLAFRVATGDQVTTQAKKIRRLIRDYEANVWPRDRERKEMPAAYAGKANEFLFIAFKERPGKMPAGISQLRKILGD